MRERQHTDSEEVSASVDNDDHLNRSRPTRVMISSPPHMTHSNHNNTRCLDNNIIKKCNSSINKHATASRESYSHSSVPSSISTTTRKTRRDVRFFARAGLVVAAALLGCWHQGGNPTTATTTTASFVLVEAFQPSITASRSQLMSSLPPLRLATTLSPSGRFKCTSIRSLAQDTTDSKESEHPIHPSDDDDSDNDNGINGNNDGDDPRLYRKRQRREETERQQQRQQQQQQQQNRSSKQQQQQRLMTVERQRELRKEVEKRRLAKEAMKLPEQPLVQTIGGGTAMIFEMARQMFWEAQQQQQQQQLSANNVRGPPRWHPTSGISDYNPQFRTSSPVMNNQGYAGTIWRNVRKDRPSLWRYALRTYDRMSMQQQQQQPDQPGFQRVERTNVHHEGALVACAKLGLWQRAMEIYESVEAEQQRWEYQHLLQQQSMAVPRSLSESSTGNNVQSIGNNVVPSRVVASAATTTTTTSGGGGGANVYITEHMLLSVIRACVRASRQAQKYHLPKSKRDAASLLKKRRAPLDAAVQVLHRLHVRASTTATTSTATAPTVRKSKSRKGNRNNRDFPLVARHVNPIAAAYQSMGLINEAALVLETFLTERTSGPEGEDGADPFNVHDVHAKDKASYSLLVQGAVSNRDFVAAVEALRDMTEAGLFPSSRHLNAWTEISERKTKHRATRSWTKKREGYWLESVR